MLANFPWPQTILGLAAALGILVIYDVVLTLLNISLACGLVPA